MKVVGAMLGPAVLLALAAAGPVVPDVVPTPSAREDRPTLPGSVAEALDRDIARAQEALEALDAFEERLERSGREQRARLDAAGVRAAELAGRLQIHAARTPEIGDLYDAIVVEVERARAALADALTRAHHPSAVPRFEPRLDPAGLELPALTSRLERLARLRVEIETRREALERDERALRHEAVDGWGARVRSLDASRIRAIDRLPDARRSRVLGVGREGIAQLRREIGQLALSARLYRFRLSAELDRLPDRLRDVFTIGSATWTLVKGLAAVALFFFLRRRGPAILIAARRLLRGSASSAAGRGRADTLVGLVGTVAPWGLFLALIATLRWALGPLTEVDEVDLPLRVATLYGIYRLAIDVLFALVMRAIRRYRLAVDETRAAEVLRSVRTMMRVVVGILVLLLLSEHLVGRGYLYHLIVRFAWVFVLGAAFVLLARWRRPIADAFLRVRPAGRLATLVERSRDRWYGVFVSAAAFGLLAGHAALQVGRDFAMGFDQTRRALAFMFRRQVEKRAEQRGYADVDPGDLPPALVAAFDERPVAETTPAIDHYPGLDRLHAMVGPWLAEDVGASFLLTGEKGIGKTSWLHRIDAGEVPVDHLTLDHRVLSESRLVSFLARGLALPEPVEGMAALRKALAAGPKRVVTVDLAQNLFLGKVGGYDTFEGFVSLVEATCGQVFWVSSISAFAWVHLSAVRPDLIVFRDHEGLTAWSEDQIGAMLRARTEAAGVDVVYDDLLLDPRGIRDPARRTETAEQYTRLLWDYSDGNPRVALHFWLRSLVPDVGGRLRVRLFRAPTSTDVDGFGDRSRFLLAAIVVHENLSLQEASEATRYPLAVCRLQLERLLDDGLLTRARGRYRLSTHWHRAVVRSLKRGNLLSD